MNKISLSPLTKTQATELIKERTVQLKHELPTRTLQSIGDEVGITRERVRQILKEEGLSKMYPPREYQAKRANLHSECASCGVHLEIHEYSARRKAKCNNCRDEEKDRLLNTHSKCPECGIILKHSKAYLATRQRRAKAYHDNIGKGNISEKPFCSRKCSARYHKLGINFGFGAPKGDSNIYVQPTQFTHERGQFIDLWKTRGYTYKEIWNRLTQEDDVEVSQTTIRRWHTKYINLKEHSELIKV